MAYRSTPKEIIVKQETESRSAWGTWIGAAALGAMAMFMLDPERGRQRRAQSAGKARQLAGKAGNVLSLAGRHLGNRLRGSSARLRSALAKGGDASDDAVVVARVRARLGRIVSHPHAVEVTASHGRVSLRGPVLTHEKARLLGMMHAIPGVHEVVDQLEEHERAENIPGLQGQPRHATGAGLESPGWHPALRGAAIAGGGALGYYALVRRSPLSLAFGALGLALLARGIGNVPLARMAGAGRLIEVRKSIEIHASAEQIFDLWSDVENLPRFMSHLSTVKDLGNGRSHWVLRGPAGASFEWDSVVTESRRPVLLAWQSLPGSPFEHGGSVHLEPSDAGTRVTVQFSYRPPGGALGHALAAIVGGDPGHLMADDLTRMKNFIETGKVARDAARYAPSHGDVLH
jgi:uncharacterized membrane protein